MSSANSPIDPAKLRREWRFLLERVDAIDECTARLGRELRELRKEFEGHFLKHHAGRTENGDAIDQPGETDR